MTETQPLPLSGIQVLDFSRLLPGPYATMLLADMGAEVIKVETPRLGDYARTAPDEFGGSGMFNLLNRNKMSLGLNYRNKTGRQIVKRLASKADVILESFKPGAMARWDFDYESLKAENPGLVYCSLSGYGQTGPYADRAGHDVNYTAVGGLVGLNGRLGEVPVTNGVQIADLGAGMLVVTSILATLYQRTVTGNGRYLDVAMLDLAVSWSLPVAGGWFFHTGNSPGPGELPLSGGWPCYNVYETADNQHLSLGALEDPFWRAFCAAVERSDLLPYRLDPAYIPILGKLFKEKTLEEWLAVFEGTEACVEPINTIEEMIAHPQVQHRGLVGKHDPEISPVPETRSPIPFPGVKESSPAPALGQDTDAVLQSAGYSVSEIDEFVKKRVVSRAG